MDRLFQPSRRYSHHNPTFNCVSVGLKNELSPAHEKYCPAVQGIRTIQCICKTSNSAETLSPSYGVEVRDVSKKKRGEGVAGIRRGGRLSEGR